VLRPALPELPSSGSAGSFPPNFCPVGNLQSLPRSEIAVGLHSGQAGLIGRGGL